MLVVRPFRAVRPAKDRVDLAALVADAAADVDDRAVGVARDPRHLGQLLAPSSPREAAFIVQDMLRAGVLVRDRAPALTIVRSRLDDEAAATCVLGALRAGEGEPAAAVSTDVIAAPIVVTFVDKKGRIARVVDNETEREPDAAFVLTAAAGKTAVEVWIVDDDSAAARLASLLENAEPSTASPPSSSASWQLGCFVDVDEPRGPVPVGICLLPTTNAV